MIITATVVIVFLVWGDVGLDRRMPVETSNIARPSAQVPRLSLDVAVCQDSKDGEDGGEICSHVETTCSSLHNLSEVDQAVPRQRSIIVEQIERWTRPTTVGRLGVLVLVSWFRALVVRIH